METGNMEPGGKNGKIHAKEEVKMKRRGFFDSLLAATREKRSEGRAFATSGAIDHILIGSLVVKGAPEESRLPLSPPGVAALRSVSEQAPHGQGLNTVLDTSIRRAWQVDASKLSFLDDPRFLTEIQEIATRTVKELVPDNNAPVEAHLYRVLSFEAGGSFKVHRNTEKEPGAFAALFVQLPTHAGFQGGELIVTLRGETKVFNCTEKASKRVYYTAFLPDCRITLAPLKRGSCLYLGFNLVRRNNNAGNVNNLDSPMWKLEAVLRPWLEAIGEDDHEESNLKLYPTKLAIPLQHKYTPANLSFSGLKGEDAVLCQVLVNCLDRRLDVHLCLMTKKEMGTPAGLGEGDASRQKYRAPWTGVGFTMDDVYDEELEASGWVGVDDQKLPIFPWFLDMETEVVLGSDEEPFYKNPDEYEYEGWTGNKGPSLDYFYHRAMVVLWPKSKAVATITEARRPNNIYFAIHVPEDADVLSLLNVVERLQKEKNQHAHGVLRQLLAHCEKKYQGIWRRKGRGCTDKAKCVSSRLMDMCIMAGDLADTLRVLKLHSQVFQVQKYDSNGRPSYKVPGFIGLRNQFVCKSIAAAVHTHGWTGCGEAVLLLLQKDRVVAEGEYYAQLAIELQQLGHSSEALLIATETLKLVLYPVRFGCPLQLLSSVVKMLCISGECLQELGSKFLEWVRGMDSMRIYHVLDDMTMSIFSMASPDDHAEKIAVNEVPEKIAVKQDSAIFRLFHQVCEIFIARDLVHFIMVTQGFIPVVLLVYRFFLLGDSKVLDNVIQSLLRQANPHKQQHLLKELLASDLLWNALVVEARGRDALRALLEARLAWLTTSQRPQFNWCQPLAQLPQHPTIEAFLKSPQRKITYRDLSSLHEARKVALLFDGQYHNGYCATGTEIGCDAGAYCVIKKSPVAFQHVLEHWRQEQREVKPLRDKLQIILECCDRSGARIKRERVKEETNENQAAEGVGEERARVNEETNEIQAGEGRTRVHEKSNEIQAAEGAGEKRKRVNEATDKMQASKGAGQLKKPRGHGGPSSSSA